ncbi:MAG: DUF1800 domain-containing protein [Pyrinomonadaceae bacterium]
MRINKGSKLPLSAFDFFHNKNRDTKHPRIFALIVGGLMFVTPLAPLFVSNVNAQTRRARATNRNSNAPSLDDEQRIAHVLSRLTFGARPQDYERVRAMGVEAFIAQQLDPEAIEDTTLDAKLNQLPTLSLSLPTLIAQYNPPKPPPTPSPTPFPQASPSQSATTPPANPAAGVAGVPIAAPAPAPNAVVQTSPTPAVKPQPTPAPKPMHNPQEVVTDLQRAALLRAVYSERQLNEVLVGFWENHFSIYSQKEADRWLLTQFDREAIRPFAMGRFRELLGATAHSPAMLYYLDNWQSAGVKKYPAANGKPARTTGGLNENYARELMELHTLGVDAGYTQQDVIEVARCFTGWTITKPNEIGLFTYNPNMHDNGEKIVLGHKISAGGGIKDAETILDILAAHPSTAKFMATKLCRRFISDDPPASVVTRAADAFTKSGGDMRETLRAIFTSPECFSQAAFQAKVRSPFEYAAASLRAFNADTDGTRPILDAISRMGQQIFGRLTPDGYPDRADQWLSTGQLLARLNFANSFANNRIKGTHIDFARYFAGVEANDPHQVAAQIARLTLGVKISPKTNNALDKLANAAAPQALSPTKQGASFASVAVSPSDKGKPANIAPPAYIADMLTLIVGAPEFQRR